jgi:hypothetical protein
MKQFTYVEDYLEIIAGQVDIVTGKRIQSWIFSFTPIISLARYDVDVLNSMTDTTIGGKPLTERQGELACKIILKYARQLATKGVDVAQVQEPKWRIPLRKMDYSRRLYIENDKLILRFPYDNTLIEGIRQFTKESQGNTKWNKDTKQWEIGLTEYNLSWMHTWATANKFEIATEVETLMSLITECEKTPYAIELFIDNNQLNIRNAPDTLIEYVTSNIADLTVENLIKIVDYSSIIGYTVDIELSTAIENTYGKRFCNLLTNRNIKMKPSALDSTDDFDTIIQYAEQVGRFPVVLFEPDLSTKFLEKVIGKGVYLNGNSKKIDLDKLSDIKFIHTYAAIQNMEKIPLVISSAGMVFGSDKQIMLQRAEKVVYCATDVYNKKKTNTKVKDIAG